MEWYYIDKDGLPDEGSRVLTYSPIYESNHELAFRLMNGQFVKYCKEITCYSYLISPKQEN